MRTMHVETLKSRVERADYVVDPHAVAQALLERVLGRRSALAQAAQARQSRES